MQLVPDSEDGDDLPASHHRDYQFPEHRGMAVRQTLAVREGGIVVMDDRFPCLDAIDPDPGLSNGVVGSFSFGPAEVAGGSGGPRLKVHVLLLGVVVVIEADETGGKPFQLIQRCHEDLFQGVGLGGCGGQGGCRSAAFAR